MKYIFIFLLLFTSLHALQKPLRKVSLQLQWLDQFQFAGYYMAKEKGFYKDAGFDVEIKKFSNKTDVIDDVLNGRTTYGIGRSSLIWSMLKEKKYLCLVQYFNLRRLLLYL
ncbi:MAG: ABC transporter substrate-binding protein [Sulfurimonas sp.]|uniref:ABC transporter substrate-binding protein n=1 Tax=Sulfurimonas sp. TaxID=2022749 RepID=UPI003D11761C